MFNPMIIEDDDIATSKGKTDKVVKKRNVEVKKPVVKVIEKKTKKTTKTANPPQPVASKKVEKKTSNVIVTEPKAVDYLAPKPAVKAAEKKSTKVAQTPTAVAAAFKKLKMSSPEEILREQIAKTFNNNPKLMRNVERKMIEAIRPAGKKAVFNYSSRDCIMMI